MAEIGTGYIKVLYDVSGLEEASSGLMGKITPLMGKYGKLAGASLGVGIAVGVGVELAHIGETLEEAHNKLRQQTGRTGEALDGLMHQTEAIAEQVPVSFDKAADAVAAVTQKLHLAGPEAEHVAESMSKLARVTGTDVKDDVASVTGVLGRWGLAADKARGVTNLLFRASQQTGTSFADIAKATTKGASIMQRFGFGIGDTASIMAKLEQRGFTVTKMTMGLNSGLAKMAKAGQDPAKVFPKLVEQIKNAENPTKALAIAVGTFGTRAGTELTSAIRQGVFSTDAITKAIKNGKETVDKASDSTLTLGDRWTMFKNTLEVAVAPAAEGLIKLLNEGMAFALKELPPLIDQVEAYFHKAWPTMGKDVSDAAKNIETIITQLVIIVRAIWNSWWGKAFVATVTQNLKVTIATLKAALKIIADVLRLAAALLQGHWGAAWQAMKDTVRDTLSGIVSIIRNVPVVAALIHVASVAYNAAVRIGNQIKAGVVSGVSGLGAVIVSLVNGAIGFLNRGMNSIRSHWPDAPGLPGPPWGNNPIPTMAHGGVITSPTLTWVGETARSRPEIVTPERLLRQIMREEQGAGTYALTITNWDTGTGYITALAGGAVAAGRRADRQKARMVR